MPKLVADMRSVRFFTPVLSMLQNLVLLVNSVAMVTMSGYLAMRLAYRDVAFQAFVAVSLFWPLLAVQIS